MNKIKCPHCGHWQQPSPHVVLCNNCYEDIKEVVDTYFRKYNREAANDIEQPGKALRRGAFSLNQPGSGLIGRAWTLARDHAAKESRSRGFSGPSVIFTRIVGTFFGRFWTIFPLMYLSISFFLLIGIFLSIMGVQTNFPDEYPADPSMAPVFAVGIAACLFVFLYTQAAFIFALSSEDLSFGDALMRTWQRFPSYVALILLMVASVGVGTAIFIIPGIVAGILFSFAPFILARESVGPIAALTRSVRYVSGSWLQVSLRLAPVGLIVIMTWLLFAYVGVPILMAVKNEFAFIFIIAGLVSIPILIITILACAIYDDLSRAGGLAPSTEVSPSRSAEEMPPEVTPATATGVAPFPELMKRSWALYRKRFVTLSMLNLISYLPHVVYLAVLLAAFVALRPLLREINALGEFGILFFAVLPKWILVLFFAASALCFILHVLLQIFGLVFYLIVELAYVYAIADEKISVWGVIRQARKRLEGFFWTELYRKSIISTGWVLLVPGALFWVWYQFTPYVFALQREEGRGAWALWESRELVRDLWGTVCRYLLSLRILPLVLGIILVWFIFAGLPFYWLFGTLLFVFKGHYLPGTFTIYSPHFWTFLYALFFLLFGGFYLPFQKVVMYVLYRELKETKADRGGQSYTE